MFEVDKPKHVIRWMIVLYNNENPLFYHKKKYRKVHEPIHNIKYRDLPCKLDVKSCLYTIFDVIIFNSVGRTNMCYNDKLELSSDLC